MKRAFILLGFIASAILVYGQEDFKEEFTIPLSNPGAEGILKVGQVNGDIIVKGYNGQEVLVLAEVKSRSKDRSGKTPPPGMKRIQSNPVEITAREDDNEVEINTESWKRRTDLTISVPFNFDLGISTVYGDISVTNVKGAMEVSNVNGPIKMTEIEGSVLANTVNGAIEVRLNQINTEAQMSFVTLNGDVDVTLPSDAAVTARMKSDRGDIYSDFDMDTETAREEVKNTDDGEYEVSINSFVVGRINGGGPEYTFKNMHGDIIIRKGN